jgi:hypothetical protein
MRTRLTFIIATMLVAFAALGPAAQTAVAGGGRPVYEEIVIDDHHTHDEGGGLVIEFDTDGLVKTWTFPDGRVITSQETTSRQLTTQDGVLVSDATSTSTIYAVTRGEETLLNRAKAHNVVLVDGQTCVSDFAYLYVNGREVINRFTGPNCS